MDLSIIEQSPRLRTTYTQLCFCFSCHQATSKDKVVETLQNGLERLKRSFPWIAGQVVIEGASKNDSGVIKIVPYYQNPLLVVKDLTQTDDAPTYDELKNSRFPFRMLHEREICPRTTLGGGPSETPSDPAPVLLLQVNFIPGGLLLSVVVCHSAMDIVGQAQIIRLLSKACNNEQFTGEEVESGNCDRKAIIPLFDEAWQPVWKPGQTNPDSSSQKSQAVADDYSTSSLEHFTWAYFSFEPDSLADLKAFAQSTLPSATAFVSTDDSISALIWQAIARARLNRLDPSTESIFTRAIDMRPFMSISASYPGNLASKTAHNSTLQALATSPLGEIASDIRSKLVPDTLKHDFRASATILSRTRDKGAVSPRDRTQYVVMSSWVKADCCHVDFGLGLGKPDAVRRPAFQPLEGVVYLLPRAVDGEIVAGICLRNEDMQKLRDDDLLGRFAEYIG